MSLRQIVNDLSSTTEFQKHDEVDGLALELIKRLVTQYDSLVAKHEGFKYVPFLDIVLGDNPHSIPHIRAGMSPEYFVGLINRLKQVAKTAYPIVLMYDKKLQENKNPTLEEVFG